MNYSCTWFSVGWSNADLDNPDVVMCWVIIGCYNFEYAHETKAMSINQITHRAHIYVG